MTSVKATCTVGPNGKPCDSSVTDTPNVVGTITFEQIDATPTSIKYTVSGLTPGLHAFHIHESADFSNGCMSAGPHYNPHGKTHGDCTDENRHAGDLGNIEANADGVAEGEMTADQIHLSGEFSVVGRSVMVHAGVDDLGKGGHELSLTTGNAGGRLACGEITVA